ncbi:MAG: 23S rRNA (adenine(2503)-C(2))-methyltransferase RlmN [Candidatus Aminicenantia bacterium]
MENLLGKDKKELENLLLSFLKEPYRINQVYQWIYQKFAKDFISMTNIPKEGRMTLSERFSIDYPKLEKERVSKDGSIKFFLKLKDGLYIESVFLPETNRNTFCISTQVGCKMGCKYCLTAKMGFKRNLFTDEILGQILILLERLKRREKRVNIVFMGMGEPLDNLQNLRKALLLIADPNGIAISPRRITVSTIGIPENLSKIIELPRPPKIAISLNTLDEDKRKFLMPATRKYKLKELLKEMESLRLKKGQKITIEWVLIKNVNDGDNEIRNLKELSRRIPIKVNVIPYNYSPLLPFERTDEEDAESFALKIENAGISVTVRKRRGEDIEASCGQLAILEKT